MYDFVFFIVICSVIVCCWAFLKEFYPAIIMCCLNLCQSVQSEIKRIKENREKKKRVHCVIICPIPVATETSRLQHTMGRVVPDAIVIE